MNKKYIVLREGYDWLYIGNDAGEITVTESNSLNKYITNNLSNNLVLYGFNKLKFINYVGVISIDNLEIEILPKISLTGAVETDRKQLLVMLSKCKKLSMKVEDLESTDFASFTLVDVISKLFTSKLLKELRKGLYYEYVNTEESINRIKGKLLVTEHIKSNAFNKTKVFCKFDEFTTNNFLNYVFVSAIKLLLPLVKDKNVKDELGKINSLLEDIESDYINKGMLNSYALNRNNGRFKEAYNVAKIILNNMTMDNSRGNANGFSLLYEMNYLYEEYIGVILKEAITDDIYSVETQVKGKYLLKDAVTGRNKVALKPDIIVYKNGVADIIIDTKWKSAVYNNVEVYSQGDIYQMYAYVTRYSSARKSILVYPQIEEIFNHSSWMIEGDFGNKGIDIKEISLEDSRSTCKMLIDIVKG